MNDFKKLEKQLNDLKAKNSFEDDYVKVELTYNFDEGFSYYVCTKENKQLYNSIILSLDQFNSLRGMFKTEAFKNDFNDLLK